MLDGVTVLVAGAGLAGLAAAHDLAAMGAAVTVVEARDRVGGRVWTIRNGFVDDQHAEAGGDMIDESQHEMRRLAASVGLKLSRILRGGLGYGRPRRPGPGARRRRGHARLGSIVAKRCPTVRSISAGGAAMGFADHRRHRPSLGRPVARRQPCRRRAARHGGRSARILSRRSRGALAARTGRSVRVERRRRRPKRPFASTAATIGSPRRSPNRSASGCTSRRSSSPSRIAASRSAPASNIGRQLSQVTTDFLRLHPAGQSGPPPADHPRSAATAAQAIAALQLRAGDQDAAAVLETLLAPAGTAIRLRLAAVLRRGLGRQRRTARHAGDPDVAGRRRRERRHRRLVGREGVGALARSLDWLGSRSGRVARIASRRRGTPIRSRAAATPSSIPHSLRRCGRGWRNPAAACFLPASTPATPGRAI